MSERIGNGPVDDVADCAADKHHSAYQQPVGNFFKVEMAQGKVDYYPDNGYLQYKTDYFNRIGTGEIVLQILNL